MGSEIIKWIKKKLAQRLTQVAKPNIPKEEWVKYPHKQQLTKRKKEEE